MFVKNVVLLEFGGVVMGGGWWKFWTVAVSDQMYESSVKSGKEDGVQVDVQWSMWSCLARSMYVDSAVLKMFMNRDVYEVCMVVVK